MLGTRNVVVFFGGVGLYIGGAYCSFRGKVECREHTIGVLEHAAVSEA